MTAAEAASVLRVLTEAKVQLVVVGDPGAESTLRLVVASHPTNLAALGGTLDELGAVLKTPGVGGDAVAGGASEEADGAVGGGAGPARLGDPQGAMTVATPHGTVDLLLGGPGRSLYADTVEVAEVRSVAGVDVRWVPSAPTAAPQVGRSGANVARRLLGIADAVVARGPAPADRREEPGRPAQITRIGRTDGDGGGPDPSPDATKGATRRPRPSSNEG